MILTLWESAGGDGGAFGGDFAGAEVGVSHGGDLPGMVGASFSRNGGLLPSIRTIKA